MATARGEGEASHSSQRRGGRQRDAGEREASRRVAVTRCVNATRAVKFSAWACAERGRFADAEAATRSAFRSPMLRVALLVFSLCTAAPYAGSSPGGHLTGKVVSCNA